MEHTTRLNRVTYWFKYLAFWILFGAVCEMLGFNFSLGVIGVLSLLLPDYIFRKKNKK